MNIHLKGILTVKRLIFFSAPAIIIIGAVLIYFISFRHPPETKKSIIHLETKPSQVEAKRPQKSTNKRINILTPVNVVDDAFKGYNLNKESDAEHRSGDEQKAAQDKGTANAVSEEMTAQFPHPENAERHIPAETKQEVAKGKEEKPQEPMRGESATLPASPAGKSDQSGAKSVVQDEGNKMLNERMAEVGLSGPDKKKMVQSYLELRKVLPEKEAQKMIMWKITHEKK